MKDNYSWLDSLMEQTGKKIINGIVISAVRDTDYDTEPLENWLKQTIISQIEIEKLRANIDEAGARFDVWQIALDIAEQTQKQYGLCTQTSMMIENCRHYLTNAEADLQEKLKELEEK